MGINFNFLRLLFKYSIPLSLILFPIISAYSYLNPSPISASILSSYIGQTTVLVGYSYSAKSENVLVSRSYILFPSVFSDPKVITIEQHNQDAPVVSESIFKLIFFCGWVLTSFVGLWWFWFRVKNENPPNLAFKRDALKRAP